MGSLPRRTGGPRLSNGRNHRCFTQHVDRLVTCAGGQWVVVAGGKILGIGPKRALKRMVRDARRRYPEDTPLVAPLPTDQDLPCVLAIPADPAHPSHSPEPHVQPLSFEGEAAMDVARVSAARWSRGFLGAEQFIPQWEAGR